MLDEMHDDELLGDGDRVYQKGGIRPVYVASPVTPSHVLDIVIVWLPLIRSLMIDMRSCFAGLYAEPTNSDDQ
jgi:hypothetical protein